MRPKTRRFLWLSLVGVIAIVIWQSTFARDAVRSELDSTYKVYASTGVHGEKNFFFFLRHTGLYPILADPPPAEDTDAEAARILLERPRTLYQDHKYSLRSGDRGRVYLFFVDWILRGDSLDPRLRPANILAFVVALSALWIAGIAVKRPGLVALLVIFFGSNPFQIYAVYGEENVFGWPITMLVLLLAVNMPLFDRKMRRRGRYPFIAAALSGLLLALLRTVRSEPSIILLVVLFACLTLPKARMLKRAALVAIASGTFVVAGAASAGFLSAKLETAKTAIKDAGGVPYTGPVENYHEFWHPVFCGLGDYDLKYGYAWDDRVAYAYAKPILEQYWGAPHDLDVTYWAQKESYDGEGRYPIAFFEYRGYHQIIREKVLHDIRSDPRWYARILNLRFWKILTDNTPVSIALGSHRVGTGAKTAGLVTMLLFLALVVRKQWFEVKLIVFSSALSLVPFLIYSDRGMTFYSVFHLTGAAIAATFFWDALRGNAAQR